MQTSSDAIPAGTAIVQTADAAPTTPETDGARTAGPFFTYGAAYDYAYFLEYEYGYITVIVLANNGFYYVVYA